MKKLFILLLFSAMFNNAQADQLAYISQEDALSAVVLIKKAKKVIDFCGCCDGVDPLKVKIVSAEARFTNYENFYEVYITYKDANGVLKTTPVDLAYLWIKYKGNVQTVGKTLNLDHDPCIETINWKVK